jgi:Ca2+-binding RTX toxin-like protein
MRRAIIAIAALSVCLTFGGRAQAATVSFVDWWDKYGQKGTLLVTAEPGELNDLVVEFTGRGFRVTDSVPLRAGELCKGQADGSVTCVGYDLQADLGDRNDRFRLSSPGTPAFVSGGSGDDVLIAENRSGTRFTGGPGDDVMIGGPGYDWFLEGPDANGSDVMDGDRLDAVSYEERVRPVHADLQGDADDGELGERDRIGSEIRTLWGGHGADTLIGNALPNDLHGEGGRNLILGGAGQDTLFGGGSFHARKGSDQRIYAGTGNDLIQTGGGDDLLGGGRGRDYLQSGNGRDRLLPGPGQDIVIGGPANDVILARDGNVDEIDCGRGWDRLRNDPLDWQPLPRCERHDNAEVLGGPLPRPPPTRYRDAGGL